MSEMERIWAPWRLDYVQEESKDDGCFLCRAERDTKDRENLVLWRTGRSFAMLNRWPYNNGHLLVAPKAHKAEFSELTDEEMLDQMKLLRKCKEALKDSINPHGFNVGLNEGRAAGAGLEGHLHWHIVPRWHGDSNFMPVVASAKVIPQSLEALWELLMKRENA